MELFFNVSDSSTCILLLVSTHSVIISTLLIDTDKNGIVLIFFESTNSQPHREGVYDWFCVLALAFMKCFWGGLKISRYILSNEKQPKNIAISFSAHITQPHQAIQKRFVSLQKLTWTGHHPAEASGQLNTSWQYPPALAQVAWTILKREK